MKNRTVRYVTLVSAMALGAIGAICVTRPYCGEWRFAMSDMFDVELDARGEVIQPEWQMPTCDAPDIGMNYVLPYHPPVLSMTYWLETNQLFQTIGKANGSFENDAECREILRTLEVSAVLSNIPVFTARVTSGSEDSALRTIKLLEDCITRAIVEDSARKRERRLDFGDVEAANDVMRIRTLSVGVAPKRLLDFRRFEKPDNGEYWSCDVFRK